MSLLLLSSGTGAPAVDTTTTIYEQPEDEQPLTAWPDRVVDAWGDERWIDIDDPAQGSYGLPVASIGPALYARDVSGVVNGDFHAGPPDPFLPIGDENPLPGWTWVSGTAISAYWVTDTSAPAGRALRWRVQPGAAVGDLAYIEQIIPVSGAREDVRYPILTVDPGSTNDVSWYRELQPLRYDGVAAGGVDSQTDDWTWDLTPAELFGVQRHVQGIPDDARFLRVRIGAKVTSATTSVDEASLRDVWCDRAEIVYASIQFADTALPATGARAIWPVSSNAQGDAANVEVPFGRGADPSGAVGWVKHITANLSTGRTSGALKIEVIDTSGGASIVGPAVEVNGTNTLGDSKVGTWELAHDGNHFEDGALLRARAEVTSGTFAPTSADVQVHVVLALIIGAT